MSKQQKSFSVCFLRQTFNLTSAKIIFLDDFLFNFDHGKFLIIASMHLQNFFKMFVMIFQLERFRNRVIQAAYSSGSTKAPEGEISDDQLVDTLKKLAEERTEFQSKVKEMEKQLKLTDSSSNVFKRNITKLRTDLEKTIVSNCDNTSSLNDRLFPISEEIVFVIFDQPELFLLC